MILFGHLGLTTGIVKAAEAVPLIKKKKQRVDYRFLQLGSILPDLIDKPIGAIFMRDIFHNSRVFAHSLLFSVTLMAAGFIVLRKRKNNRLLIVGIGCGIHLILDSMWENVKTLFWPFLGLQFPTRPEGNWSMEALSGLLQDYTKLFAEVLGFLILVFLFVRAIRKKRLGEYFKNGRL